MLARLGCEIRAGFKKNKMMKLYIRFGSLHRFQELREEKEYLRKFLTQESATSWFVEDGADLREIERILVSNRINYVLKDDN